MNLRPASADSYFFGGVALPIKEALRGIRHVVMVARDVAICFKDRLPDSLRSFGTAVIMRFDRFAAKVDRNSSLAVHRFLDPAISRDAETAAFSRLISRDAAAILFAKVAYDNLKLTIPYICRNTELHESFFVSEMLAAFAYRKAAKGFPDTSDDIEKAALLLSSMCHSGVIRTAVSANAFRSSDDAIRGLAGMANFATVLWLVVARDCTPEGEEGLLFACCDLAIVLAPQIDEAGEDSTRLNALLNTHADMV